MRNVTSTVLLLCSLGLFCVLCLESSTIEVQSGQSVTLLCYNYTISTTSIIWFRAVKRSIPRHISTLYNPSKPATLTDGFQDGRFTVKSNLSHIFLTIDPVNTSDSGLYFCGYTVSSDPVIKSPTYLDVQEDMFDRKMLVPVLGGLVIFLIVVIVGLAVTNRKLQKALKQDLHAPETPELECSDTLNYASVKFCQKPSSCPVNSQQETSTYAAVKRTGPAPELLSCGADVDTAY